MKIHPTAIIEDGAKIGADVEIGPFCRIGPDVSLGDGARLVSHVVIEGATQIGARARIHPFAALGGAPQHLGHRGERTKLIIGSDVTIREHVTMNTGTADGKGETRVGNGGLFMAGSHVAHDCVIGDKVIFANNATLGGFVSVGDNAFLGGLCAVHQFCRVGANAFVGGCAAAPTDLIPFGSAIGNHAHLAGLNIVGMKRRGMDRRTIHAIRRAYRDIFEGEGAFKDRVAAAADAYRDTQEVMMIVDFIQADTRRPIMIPEK